MKEAESDGMWWKHVAESYEILGEKKKAEEAWREVLGIQKDNHRKNYLKHNTYVF